LQTKFNFGFILFALNVNSFSLFLILESRFVEIIMIYYRHAVHITGTIKQRKSTKVVSHNALQNRCLHTTNTDRSETL